MDKTQYLISVFERLAKESPTIAEYSAYLKGGRATDADVETLYSLVSQIMESTAAKMTGKRAAALTAMLTGLREKEREETKRERAEDVLETFF